MSLCGPHEYHWALLLPIYFPLPWKSLFFMSTKLYILVEFSSTECLPALTLSCCHISHCPISTKSISFKFVSKKALILPTKPFSVPFYLICSSPSRCHWTMNVPPLPLRWPARTRTVTPSHRKGATVWPRLAMWIILARASPAIRPANTTLRLVGVLLTFKWQNSICVDLFSLDSITEIV